MTPEYQYNSSLHSLQNPSAPAKWTSSITEQPALQARRHCTELEIAFPLTPGVLRVGGHIMSSSSHLLLFPQERILSFTVLFSSSDASSAYSFHICPPAFQDKFSSSAGIILIHIHNHTVRA